ncbi:MAG: hypothetical protein ACKO2S_01645 [Burkholderiaceae bacterium]
MRFVEFAPQAKPAASRPVANTPATPLPTNTPPTAVSPEPIKVYPRAWQHEWVQRYLAAQMAKDAQTIKPTELDMVKAFTLHAQAQRQADADYATQRRQQEQPQQRQITPAEAMSVQRTQRKRGG